MFKKNSKEDKFYEMLSKSANIVNESAKELRANLDLLANRETNVNKTELLEDKGDELVRNIIKELNEAFITPIDREDIYEIVKNMDNILDLISSTMHRFIMFNIKESTEECKVLSDMLVEITENLIYLMDELKVNGCKSKNINEKIMSVCNVESAADKVFRKTVGELFRSETNPLVVIKWKEIYQIIENAIDNCQRVAIIVEGVVIKNA